MTRAARGCSSKQQLGSLGAVPPELLRIVPGQLKRDRAQQLVRLNASLVVAMMLKKEAKDREGRSRFTFP